MLNDAMLNDAVLNDAMYNDATSSCLPSQTFGHQGRVGDQI